MIEKLFLENFKGISNKVEIKFSTITLIFGLNNVGKSSVIQSLDIFSNLSNKFEIPLITNFKNYGSHENIINKQAKNKKALIGININKRNEKKGLEFEFTKNLSEANFYDNFIDKTNPSFSIEFDGFGYTRLNNISRNKKSYEEFIYRVNQAITNNKQAIEKLLVIINELKKYKNYQYFKDKLEIKLQEIFKFYEFNYSEEITKIRDQLPILSEELIQDFIEENLAILNKEENSQDLSDLFFNLCFSFINKSKYAETYIKKYTKSKEGENYFKSKLILLFFDKIYINPISINNLGSFNVRLRSLLRRFLKFKINSDNHLKLIKKNLVNIEKFCKAAIKKQTPNQNKIIEDIVYKNITEYRYNMNNFDRFDRFGDDDLSLMRLLRVLAEISDRSDNESYFNRGVDGDYPGLFNIRNVLIEFNSLIPAVNIFNQRASEDRIYTYSKSNNYLDKIFENRNDENFIKFLVSSMKNLGFEIDFLKIISDENSFRIKVIYDGKEIDLVDSGTGMKNMISIISQLYLDSRSKDQFIRSDLNQITCIEEPEANLHPKFQAELGQLFANISKLPSHQTKQILIETHSQNLTLRLLKLIRNGFIDKSQISFNCLFKKNNGAVDVFTPEISDNGSFYGSWPGGFFEESLYELDD